MRPTKIKAGSPHPIENRQVELTEALGVGDHVYVPLWLPGKAARAFRAGANLAPEQAVGRRTWEEFLAERLS